jgi:HEAT repeat protein
MALMSLLKDSDPEVRERAVGAAGTLRMEEAAHLLRQRLADPVDTVALRAAGALGLLGEQTGLPLVARALRRDDALGRLAARAFGEIVGHRFSANASGVQAARRYLDAKWSALQST